MTEGNDVTSQTLNWHPGAPTGDIILREYEILENVEAPTRILWILPTEEPRVPSDTRPKRV